MHEGPVRANSITSEDLHSAELYNLEDDISETRNLAATYPEKVRALAAGWRNWNRELAALRWGPASPGRRSARVARTEGRANRISWLLRLVDGRLTRA